MNLLTDCWIPVARRSGAVATISVLDLAETVDPPLAILFPRSDFRQGTLELLIGIMAVALRPETLDDWSEWQRTTPSRAGLQQRIEALGMLRAFELDGDGPRFMQDFNPTLSDGKTMSPTTLLIDGPGESTIQKNTDWFEKRPSEAAPVMSRAVAAIALYVLQANAPSGGRGHRTSVRGGGPLITIVIPRDDATVWETVIANIPYGPAIQAADLPAIFPWLAPTRTSEEGADPLSPDHVHPLQAFFGMPRRIRLDFAAGNTRPCAVSDTIDAHAVTGYRRRAFGMNYGDVRLEHPLSPYRRDPKENRTFALHPTASGVQWGYFLGTVIANDARQITPAASVAAYRRYRAGEPATVVVSGYATDNAKVEAYIEARLPLPGFLDDQQRRVFDAQVAKLVEASYLASQGVRAAIWACKADARARLDGSRSLLIVADRAFWADTDAAFNDVMARWQSDLRTGAGIDPMWGRAWLKVLLAVSLRVFDRFVALDGGGGVRMLPDKENRPIFLVAQQRRYLLSRLTGSSKAGAELFSKLELPVPERAKTPARTTVAEVAE